MSELDDIIDLQIAISDKAPEQPSFGTTLLAGFHEAWPDFVREYSAAADMLDDGFTTDDDLYKMALIVKSQNPSPSTFKVGRLETAYTQVIHMIPTVTTEGFVYSGTIDGLPWTYTVGAAATVQVIVEAVIAILNALSGITITFTEDNTKIIGTSDDAGIIHSYDIARGINLFDATTDPGLADDLALILDEDADWYGLALAANSAANTLVAAAFVEANKKVMAAQLVDWDVIDAGETDDVATDLVALSLTRTAPIYHRKIGGSEWLAAGWLAKMLTLDAGSYTAAFMTVAGVSVDTLRTGEISALAAKKVTKYTRVSGANITFEGRTPSGRFIDITIFADWLYATIQADAYSLLINNPKLPYTAAGLSAIKGAVEGSLAKGKKNPNPGLDPDFASIVIVPAVADQATADRANRIVRGIEFEDRLSGAVHGMVIRGRLSV